MANMDRSTTEPGSLDSPVKLELNLDQAAAGVNIKSEPLDPGYDEFQTSPSEVQQEPCSLPLPQSQADDSNICASEVKQEWDQKSLLHIKAEPEEDLTTEVIDAEMTKVKDETEAPNEEMADDKELDNGSEPEEGCSDSDKAFFPEAASSNQDDNDEDDEQATEQKSSGMKGKHECTEGCILCKYVCTECGEKFFSVHYLANHMQEHYRSWPFICKLCNTLFRYKGLLQRHRMKHHSESFKRCLHCQKLFDKEDELNRHLYKISGKSKEPITCLKCGEAAKCRTHLWAHLLIHKRRTPHICKDCGMVFKTEGGVTKHVLYKHTKGAHRCEVCEEAFESKLDLVNHLLTHRAMSEPNECTLCNETFRKREDLFKHLLSHNDKAFVCKLCMKAFDTKESLSTHDCDLQYCDQCGMTFSSKEHLVAHMYIHKISVGYKVCQECGQSFMSKSSYTRHMKYYHDCKPYPCKECDKIFDKRSELTMHAWNEHNRKRAYSCDECKLDFKTWPEVVAHRRTHEYKCDTCTKKYKSKYMLSKHMEVCEGKRCTVCYMEFSSPSELEVHKKCHVFKCNNCSMAFEYMGMLSRHQQVCLERCPCTECGLEFNTWAEMHMHRRNTHVYKCDKCTLTFGYRSEFKKHLESACGSGKYKCFKCGKAFKIISDMMKHSLDAHKITRPFECEKCGKRFRKKWGLTQHQANHCSTVKKYQLVCNPCHLRFFTDEDFSRHMNTEHVVPCTLCSDSFRDASELEKHYAMKHSEDEMIVATPAEEIADSIGAAANEPSNQNKMQHDKEEVKDKEQWWPCTFCDETFKDNSEFRRHCVMKHQGVNESVKEDVRYDLASVEVKKEPEEDGFGTEDSAVQQQDTDSDSGVHLTSICYPKSDGARKIVRQYGRRTEDKPYAVCTVQGLETAVVKKEPEDGVGTGNLVMHRGNNQVGGSCVAAALPSHAWNDQNSIARKNIRQYGRKANSNLASTAVQKEPGDNPGPGNLVTEWCRIDNDDGLKESLPNRAWNDENNKNRARENVRQYGRKGNKNLANRVVKEEPEDKMESSVTLPGVKTEPENRSGVENQGENDAVKTESGKAEFEQGLSTADPGDLQGINPPSAVFVQNATNNIANLLPNDKVALKVVLKKQDDGGTAAVAKQFLVIIRRGEAGAPAAVVSSAETSMDMTEDTETEIIVPN